MIRVYRYRLYPTREQEASLRSTLHLLRELYNGALQERIAAHRAGVKLSAYDQNKELVELRAVRPEFAGIHTHLLQDAVFRLDRAYRAFFRRLKSGTKAGFPRFKGRGRYNTFTFPDAKNRNGARLCAGGKRLDLTGIGKVKIKMHRPTEGQLKQVSITLGADGHWHACLCCADVPIRPLPATGARTGIDVGISTFATLSSGEPVPNPRYFEHAQAAMSRAQRIVSRRRNKRSNRRRKAVVLLAKQHDRVRKSRLDFHHRVALDLVQRFDRISVEDLNIKGLAGGMLAKQVHDAAWAQFISILASKAECASREFIKVDSRGTSQICSECGAEVRKKLSVRVHDCPHCGYVTDRDHNAARNVEQRAGHARRRGAGAMASPRTREAPTNSVGGGVVTFQGSGASFPGVTAEPRVHQTSARGEP